MRVDTTKSPCSKFMYTHERGAKEIITKCKSASSRSKIPKRHYYCKECGGWHVTSQKTKSKYN